MANSQWRLIASLIRPHRRAVGVYGAVLAFATSLPIAGALLLARFVDLAAERAPTSRLVPLAASFGVLGLVTAAATVLVTWQATKVAWRITDRLRMELAGHVLSSDLTFHRDHTPGELVTRVDADVTAMTQFLSQVVARVLAIIVLAIAAVVVMAFVVPMLAPVLGIGLLFVGWVTYAQRDSNTAATVAERRAEASVMSAAEQYLAGADDIASLAAGAHGVGRVASLSDSVVVAIKRRVSVQMRVQGTIRNSLVLVEALVLGIGAALLRRGMLSIGDVFLAFRFVAQVRSPIEGLTWRLQEAQGAAGAAARVLELLQDRRQVVDGDATIPSGRLDVRFEAVALTYRDNDDETTAVRMLDLHLRASRTLGLLGRSGSGKTSVARLLLRLVNPSTGRVVVNGVDLSTVADDHLRARITAVPQDVQLFPGTVRDNVTLFATFSDEAVREALDQVGLGAWLASLPAALDTVLGNDARAAAGAEAGMSAGQAQLLSLARALLRDPDLVVLDEATARVDPETQAAIAGATEMLLDGRTAVIIAHRIETLDVCDDIAVMADGRVVEYGERRRLRDDRSSEYARLLAAGEGVES
ncbi:MAG: ABC transporter ATP-binding protein [Acidimicrobiia bacterium]